MDTTTKAALMVHVVGEMTAAVCSHEGDVERGMEILRDILPAQFGSVAMDGLAHACSRLVECAALRKSADFNERQAWITAQLMAQHQLARVHRARIAALLEKKSA